jgi:hypothetical protein
MIESRAIHMENRAKNTKNNETKLNIKQNIIAAKIMM